MKALKGYFLLVVVAKFWVILRAIQDRGVMQALETARVSWLLWLLAILLLDNFAIASYVLVQLFRMPAGGPMKELLLRREGR